MHRTPVYRSARRRGPRPLGVAVALALAAVAPVAGAADAGDPEIAVDPPKRGSLMKQVEARFGAPATRHAAVGQPPITRWDYPGFVVYFEHEHVIHAVTVRPAG